jgi:non-ribosomal peptide synthetase-like protein
MARLVQRLQDKGWAVTVRDLLSDCDTPRKVVLTALDQQRTTAREPGSVEQADMQPVRDETAAKPLAPWHFTVLQFLFLLMLYAPGILVLSGLVAAAEIGEFFVTAQLREFVYVGTLMYLLALGTPFANLLWVMVINFLMDGHVSRNRVRPGVYPKWSRMHLRIWCIRRLEYSVLRPLATLWRSAPLLAWTLRRLGATVGSNLQCAHDVEFYGPLSLLQIGDDVAIQTGACISVSRWVGTELHVGPVHLESDCKIGMRAGVASGVTVGHGSWVTPLTPILNDIGPGEVWDGAPAQCEGHCTRLRRSADHCHNRLPFWCLELLNVAMQVVLEVCLLVLPTATIAWLTAGFFTVENAANTADYFTVTPLPEIVWQIGLYAFVTSWATIILTSALICLFIRSTAVSTGLYPSRGFTSSLLLYRIKKLNQIQRLWTWTITGQYLRALAGMRFKRVGASECDLMQNLVPELVSADSQVFWSHGCFTNVLDHGADYLRLSHLDMPANFFASNNCVAESGQLPTNFLLGVSTPGNDIRFRRQMRSQLSAPITVAGNPPLRFASANFESENAAREMPGFPLFLARFALSDVFSIGLLPIAEVLVYTITYTMLLRFGEQPVISALLALALTEGLLVAFCILVKQVLVGRNWGSDHSASFWSWRHFTYFFAQDCFFTWCRRPLRFVSGTVLANPVLRRMGCRIGRRTIVSSPMQAFDWNAVSIGDDCVVDGMLQLHSFEHMMLKVKRTEIRSGCSINFGTTLMGGSVIEPGTTLLPLSLVLKGMNLPAATYQGSPAEPAHTTRRFR